MHTQQPLSQSATTISPAEAVRFLAQAGWGAAPDDIPALQQIGLGAWLDEQRAKPISRTRPYLDQIRADIEANDPPQGDVSYARAKEQDFTLAGNFSTAWMRNIVHGADQLRQRIAWSLSQIMVVSFNSVNRLAQNGVAVADYYDTLATHALGSFRDLLLAVSLHPAMSYFLSSLGNEKPDPSNNQYPDENYAREVMQLFTVGLWELEPNGEQKRDAKGNPIATYDNRDVEAMARVFTGLWFEGRRWPKDTTKWPRQWLSDFRLAMYEAQHDTTVKTLFHGKPWQVILPAGQTGLRDIEAAIDALVNHPNTAPFIGKALIKFLVTSNPSPAYVQRVAAVFANNGSGVRGDLFAVVKAILLDDEARNPDAQRDPKHGKLQEPLLRLTRMVKAFRAGVGVADLQFWGRQPAVALQQWPMFSPSVFNFFSPGYRHLGVLAKNGLTSPEFQLLNSVSFATTSNLFAEFIDTLLHKRKAGDAPEFKFNFTAERALAGTPSALADRLNLLLCNGQMSAQTRARVVDAINRVPLANAEGRVLLGVWLAAVSPEAAILK
jgi:uncharacterized protein (DUF1800 family)